MKARAVPRRVGMNPVAQAVFRVQFSKDLLTSKISILMMEKGEDCSELLQSIGFVLAVVARACELEARNDPKSRTVRGGLSATAQLSESKSIWDPLQAVGLVHALESAEDLIKLLKPATISRAVLDITRVEQTR